MKPQNDRDVITADAESEIERLKQELRHEHEMYLRALSDFDNFRRRTERDRGGAARSGKREVILPLLDVLDGFERAMSFAGDTPSPVVEGVQAIHRKLLGILEQHGVMPFASMGEPFDPARHEAIGLVRTDTAQPGTVSEEVQRGYRMGDDTLRPARVRVAQ